MTDGCWRRAFERVGRLASRRKNQRRLEPHARFPGRNRLFSALLQWAPWIVILAGIPGAAGLFRQARGGGWSVALLFAGLCMLYLKMALSQRERTERMVRDRTAEMRADKERLEEMISERTESLSRKSAFLEALLNSSAYGTIVLDTGNKRTFQNRRAVELWRIPQAIVHSGDHEAQVRHILSIAKYPEKLKKTIHYLDAHPDESLHDEVELLDGTVLERYSSPVFSDEGIRYGRVLTFRDITQRKAAERALRESENKFRDLAEKSVVGIYLVQDGLFKYVNPKFAEIHGYTPEEFIDRKGVTDTVLPEDAPGVREKITKTLSGDFDLGRDEFRIVTKVGLVRDVEIYGGRTTYRGKEAIIGTLADVTKRKQTEAMLNWKTAFLEAQVNTSLDGILVIDSQGKRVLQNQRVIDMWKIPVGILEDQGSAGQFEHMARLAKQERQFLEKIDYLRRRRTETSRDEMELIDGTVVDTYSCPVLGEGGEYYGRIWTFREITELRRYWDMLENLSTTDGLTDLPNRRRFDEFLNREWRRSMRDQSLLSLILLDIDFFKEFNDHYGHLAGDDCLRQVAAVLREVIRRPGDLAARYGGEEFACVLPDTDSSGASTLAYKIRESMAEVNIPHFFSSVADRLTLSFGVAALVPEKGQSPADLIRLADSLLYAAKKGGRDQVRSWQQPAKGMRVNERLA